jgi:hypothetical protein
MSSRVFFPQDALDLLVSQGKVDVEGDQLVVSDTKLRYHVVEGARVLVEVITGEDPHGLIGKVKPKSYLCDELGAELLGGSMLLEDNGYDVVEGLIGEPIDDGGGEDERLRLSELQTNLG